MAQSNLEKLGMKMLSSSLSCYQSSILVKRRNVDLFSNIHDSILAEIFKRLPVKSLLRCCCVQKSWNYFIRTPSFINIHLNYNPEPNYILFESNYTDELLLRYDNQNCEEFCKLQLPSVILSTKWFATSSGLICFSTISDDGNGQIVLFNPLVRKYRVVPELLSPGTIWNTHCVYLAFGYVKSVNDYCVVKIVSYYANKVPLFGIYVYSLRSNSWTSKTIQDCILTSVYDPFESFLVNGVAFWRTHNENNENGAQTLLCFDTINGILQNIALPDEDYGYCNPCLQQFGQSVAYFTGDPEITNITMWILRGDPMKDFFWEKKFSVSLDDESIRTEEVLGIRNNGEVILSKVDDCDLVSYNCEEDKVKDFVCSWNRWTAIGMDRKDMDDDVFINSSPFIVRPFVESLVLLDAD